MLLRRVEVGPSPENLKNKCFKKTLVELAPSHEPAKISKSLPCVVPYYYHYYYYDDDDDDEDDCDQ